MRMILRACGCVLLLAGAAMSCLHAAHAADPDLDALEKRLQQQEKEKAAPPPAARAQAADLNHKGEAAFHANDYPGAIRLFQQAIQLQPDYGQAYSNLGLAFAKVGNDTEALTADYKAIEVASGDDAPRVRASGYFNIARIYEAESQWQAALDAFQNAEEEKHNDAYAKGIARMQDKLK